MTTFELYKFLHVTAAIVWVGGTILALAFTERARRADQAHALGFAKDMQFVSLRIFNPAAIVTLIFGVIMVIDSKSIDFEETWIAIGMGAIAVSAALGMAYFGPQVRRLVADLDTASDKASARLSAIVRVSRIEVLMLLIAVWAMVAKPGF